MTEATQEAAAEAVAPLAAPQLNAVVLQREEVASGLAILRVAPKGWALPRDPYYLECSVPGIFAAGDVRAESLKRVASAVGEGAMAVALVHRYLAAQ